MDDEQFQLIARAIADPSRLAALQMIAKRGEVSCSDVRDHLGLTAATVSHHVKELAASGLVAQRKEAKYTLLRLVPRVWEAYLRALRQRLM
jgi:DNA-binding transcriptional ArsR family regulator